MFTRVVDFHKYIYVFFCKLQASINTEAMESIKIQTIYELFLMRFGCESRE